MAKKRRIRSFPVVIAVCMLLSLPPSAQQSGELSLLSGDPPNPHGFFPGEQFHVGAAPESIAVGDLDGDGALDIVTANANGSVSVLLGSGNGTFASPETALAKRVFPVPGGPRSNTPLGIFAPNF